MRKLRPVALFLVLLATTLVPAWAAGPNLTTTGGGPGEVQPGQSIPFSVVYSNPSGDPATSVQLVLQTPTGETRIPGGQPAGNDPAQGITYSFTFTPQNVGTYKYHFEATSSTGQFHRTTDSSFTSYSLASKYVLLILGLLLALVGLPFFVYVGARAANKRGDPATAARVGLFVGVLAAYALYWYLFAGVYKAMGEIIAAVAALAILIGLLARRR